MYRKSISNEKREKDVDDDDDDDSHFSCVAALSLHISISLFLCSGQYPYFSFLFFFDLFTYFFDWWVRIKKVNRCPVRIKLIYICRFVLGHLFSFSFWYTQISKDRQSIRNSLAKNISQKNNISKNMYSTSLISTTTASVSGFNAHIILTHVYPYIKTWTDTQTWTNIKIQISLGIIKLYKNTKLTNAAS